MLVTNKIKNNTSHASIVSRLVKLADYLDSEDFEDEADMVDELAEGYDDLEVDGDTSGSESDVGVYESVEHDEYSYDEGEGHQPIEAGDDYNWRLHRGVLISPDGRETHVRRIKGGSFSSVYQFNNDNHSEVLIKSNEEVLDKQILSIIYESEVSSGDPINPHIPNVRMIGRTGSEDDEYGYNDNLYIMKRYNTPLRKANTKDWNDYVTIVKCWKKNNYETLSRLRPGQAPWAFAQEIFYNTIDCAEEAGVSENLIEALRILYDGAVDHGGPNYGFEISPRNVGSDEHGNIVFFDVMYDQRQLYDKQRKSKGRW